MIEPDVLINAGRNTIVYEKDAAVMSHAKEHIFKLFSTKDSPESFSMTLRELRCCQPHGC